MEEKKIKELKKLKENIGGVEKFISGFFPPGILLLTAGVILIYLDLKLLGMLLIGMFFLLYAIPIIIIIILFVLLLKYIKEMNRLLK